MYILYICESYLEYKIQGKSNIIIIIIIIIDLAISWSARVAKS